MRLTPLLAANHVKHLQRRDVLRELDARSRLADRFAAVRGMNDYQARAIDLLTSPAAKKKRCQ